MSKSLERTLLRNLYDEQAYGFDARYHAQIKEPKNRKSVRGVVWWRLLPFRIFIEVLVTLFDMALNRYLIAGLVVGVVWAPLHLATDLSSKYWMWPTVVLGMCIIGLWDGCDIFTIRHCGFAIVEGLLGTFGNEGVLKVIVGRSLGATHHCSWGIIAAWFAFRGMHGWRFRTLNWSLALLLPAVLHSVSNASTMELPGDAATDVGDTISTTELMVVLPGMASLLGSWTLALGCVYAARNVPAVIPIQAGTGLQDRQNA